MSTLELVHGWTSPLDFRLDDDGSPTDLTGFTVALVLSNSINGSPVTLAGSTALVIATGGEIRFTPGASDIQKGSYKARFKVTDGSSKIAFYPNQGADTWEVRYP